MKHWSHIKSLALGLVLGVGGMMLLGAAKDDTPPVGRFQICSSDMAAYVVDTATGRVWQRSDSLDQFKAEKLK
jgi:hypothetical protein